jgi:hypothetical protein
MAISIGTKNVTTADMAALLFEAARPLIIAATKSRQRPISIPVRRYEEVLFQKDHTNQTRKAASSASDNARLYTISLRLTG